MSSWSPPALWSFFSVNAPSLLSSLNLRVHAAVYMTLWAIEDMVGSPPRSPIPSSATRAQLLWWMVSKAHSFPPSQKLPLDDESCLVGRLQIHPPTHTHTHTTNIHNTQFSPLSPANRPALLLQVGTALWCNSCCRAPCAIRPNTGLPIYLPQENGKDPQQNFKGTKMPT